MDAAGAVDCFEGIGMSPDRDLKYLRSFTGAYPLPHLSDSGNPIISRFSLYELDSLAI
jgi:hypothetical protein